MLVASFVLSNARAEVAWVDRPMVLDPFHARFETGVATARSRIAGAPHVGGGENFEAVLGLPVIAELGVRTGRRFDDESQAIGADSSARLFDHETSNVGGGRWANPELRLRMSLLDVAMQENEKVASFMLGIEARGVVPTTSSTRFTLSPGIPMRIVVPHRGRVDLGVFLPIRAEPDTPFTISVPVGFWSQRGDCFLGILGDLRFNRVSSATEKKMRFDYDTGVGVGCTIDRIVDVKTQIYLRRVTDVDWETIGLGLGVAFNVP